MLGRVWAPRQERLRQKIRGNDEGSWCDFRPHNNGRLHYEVSMREMSVI